MNIRPLSAHRPAHRARTAVMAMAVAALGAALAACSRDDDAPTVGQALDDAVATAQAKAHAAGDRIVAEAQQARAEIGESLADARITAGVNAKLATDDELGALHIDVDTAGGHVVLGGHAPSTAARQRAEALARAVVGVLSVDNRLTVVAG